MIGDKPWILTQLEMEDLIEKFEEETWKFGEVLSNKIWFLRDLVYEHYDPQWRLRENKPSI